MDLLKYEMEWKEFFILPYFFHNCSFNLVYILSLVNKIAFDQTYKMMKKRSSQRSIQMNRVRKKKKRKITLVIFQHWRLNRLQLQYRPVLKFKSECLP